MINELSCSGLRYECKCAFGYAGLNCTHVTCDLDPCEHGSTCHMQSITEYACNCTGTGYAGVRCETRINEFECRQEACFGNQTCHPLRCDCDAINCDEVNIEQQKKTPYYRLLLITISYLSSSSISNSSRNRAKSSIISFSGRFSPLWSLFSSFSSPYSA